MKDEGEYAVQIFREMWEEYHHDILLDSENLQKALIGALRQELKDTGLEVPRGSQTDFLQYLGDGTYPIDTLAVERTTGRRGADHGASKDSQTDEEVVAVRTAPPEFVETVNEPKERNEQGGSVEKKLDAVLQVVLKMDKRVKKLELGQEETSLIDLGVLLEKRSSGAVKAKKKSSKPTNGQTEAIDSGSDGTASKGSQRKGKKKVKRLKSKKKKKSKEDLGSDGGSDESENSTDEASNDEFWESFEKIPFKPPTLTVKPAGPKMLRRALENHPSVSAYAESLSLRQARNKKETAVLARILDFLIAENGIMKVRDSKATEVAIRRISAIHFADNSNSWEAATQIEEGHTGLLSQRQQRMMLNAAKLARAVASLSENRPRSDNQDRRPTKKPKVGDRQ